MQRGNGRFTDRIPARRTHACGQPRNSCSPRTAPSRPARSPSTWASRPSRSTAPAWCRGHESPHASPRARRHARRAGGLDRGHLDRGRGVVGHARVPQWQGNTSILQAQAQSIANAYLNEITAKNFVDPDGVEASRDQYDDVQRLQRTRSMRSRRTSSGNVAGNFRVRVSVVPAALNGIPAGRERAPHRRDRRLRHRRFRSSPPAIAPAHEGARLHPHRDRDRDHHQRHRAGVRRDVHRRAARRVRGAVAALRCSWPTPPVPGRAWKPICAWRCPTACARGAMAASWRSRCCRCSDWRVTSRRRSALSFTTAGHASGRGADLPVGQPGCERLLRSTGRCRRDELHGDAGRDRRRTDHRRESRAGVRRRTRRDGTHLLRVGLP